MDNQLVYIQSHYYGISLYQDGKHIGYHNGYKRTGKFPGYFAGAFIDMIKNELVDKCNKANITIKLILKKKK